MFRYSFENTLLNGVVYSNCPLGLLHYFNLSNGAAIRYWLTMRFPELCLYWFRSPFSMSTKKVSVSRLYVAQSVAEQLSLRAIYPKFIVAPSLYFLSIMSPFFAQILLETLSILCCSSLSHFASRLPTLIVCIAKAVNTFCSCFYFSQSFLVLSGVGAGGSDFHPLYSCFQGWKQQRGNVLKVTSWLLFPSCRHFP